MMIYRHDLLDYPIELVPEFALANGLGGFCSGTSTGNLARKHQGYLVASLNPPTQRRVYVSKTVEWIKTKEHVVSFEHQTYKDSFHHGVVALSHFGLTPFPTYTYETKDVKLIKELIPIRGKNAVGVRFCIEAKADPITFGFTPHFTDRDHGDVLSVSQTDFSYQQSTNHFIVDMPYFNHQLHGSISTGTLTSRMDTWSDALRYIKDEATGDERNDVAYHPFDIVLSIESHQKQVLDCIFALEEDIPASSLEAWKEAYVNHYHAILDQASPQDDFERELIWAGHQMIAHRKSTNQPTILAGFPWFTDWGRDTMIAFGGLLLSTSRFEEAKDVLLSFAKYLHHGLIPNMFPDDGQDPLYNTVDASLWYVHAVDQYVRKTSDLETLRLLFPVLEKIIQHYQKGTLFSISMDEDGLIHAGNGQDQVTWMDVRIHGYAVTPRHGKPVEINALWYNALKVMEHYASIIGVSPTSYRELANRVKTAFLAKFWNLEQSCLYDVVDPIDASIRPNQLFAITLPYSMLATTQMNQILQVVRRELVDIYGIRSLAISDPRFKQVYAGPLTLRDHAYHMGTSWGFLMGVYLEAELIAGEHSHSAREFAKTKYTQLKRHLKEGLLGGVAEVFDGYQGSISKGCPNQAWSVGEWLRVYKDYQLVQVGQNDEN